MTRKEEVYESSKEYGKGILLMEGGFWVISFLFCCLFILPKMNTYLYNKCVQ